MCKEGTNEINTRKVIFQVKAIVICIFHEITLKLFFSIKIQGGSSTITTSKIKFFEILLNGFQQFTKITKNSILDVTRVLYLPPRVTIYTQHFHIFYYSHGQDKATKSIKQK